jgi:N-acetylneuraminic acid mutarotase
LTRQGALGGLVVAAAILAAASAPGPSSTASADDLGPRIRATATWPRDKALEVFTDPVVVKFSRPVNFASVNSSTFQVYAGNLGLVDGTYAPAEGKKGPDPRRVVFTPVAPLPRQALCTVRIYSGLQSELGRFIDEPIEFTFATSNSKDLAAITPLGPRDKPRKLPSRGPAPKVRYTFPEAGFGNVFSDDVRVRFNRPMDGETIRNTTIQVLDGGVLVPGSISFPEDDERREMLFTPTSPLFPDNNYQILVTRLVRSARGRYIKSEFRAGFGTSPLKQGTRPLHPEEFIEGPLLSQGRAFHTANAVAGGNVVLAGGQDFSGNPLVSVEVFRRDTTSVFRAPDMATARRKHASVTLQDGRVLVCGGFGPLATTLSSAEIYNPATNTWFSVGSMNVGRANHTATLLPGGKVLVASGFTTDGGPFTYTRTAELFNPQNNTWSFVGAPVTDRGGHTATLLPDGRVLLAGGNRAGDVVAELFLPLTNTFRATLNSPNDSRIFHAAVVTRAGTVLLAGGYAGQAEQFIPTTETFVHAGGCPDPGLGLSESAIYPTLTLLPGIGGRIAYIGGYVDTAGLVSGAVQVWDPKASANAGSFSAMLFTMDVPRAAHTVTTLADGRFLIAGGFGTEGAENERRLTILAPEL